MFLVGLAEGGFTAVSLGLATIGVWALLAGLLVSRRLDFSSMTPRLWFVLGALAALAALQALSTGWASDDAAAFLDLTRTLLYLGVVALVGLAARPASAPSWLAGIALGGFAIASLALASRLFGFGGDSDLASQLPLAAERLSYPLGYWNGLGYLMAMTLPPLTLFAVAGRPRQSRLALAASIPVVVVIFLTGSRGAVLAAAAGIACVIWMLPARTRAFTAAVVAAPAWTIAVVAVAARRERLDPAGDPGLWGIAIAIGLVVLALLSVLAMRALAERRLRPHLSRRAGVLMAVVSAVALVAAIGVLGLESFTGSFRGESAAGNRGVAAGLASSSDRVEFWQVALKSFAEDPLRGTGAGGFPLYWSQDGAISVAVRNAHSAPIEELGELGLLGGVLVLAILLAPLPALRAALRSAGPATRAMVGPIAGILAGGTLAVAVDWTWDLPAALAPYLVCVALSTGAALQPRNLPRGSLVVDSRFGGYEPDPTPARPAPVLRAGLAAAASAVAIWAGGVLALAGVELERSADELAEGRLAEAAASARAAAAIEPWSVEPVLRLAEIELTGGNLESARRRAEQAARMSPDDYRPWFLLTTIQVELEEVLAAAAYTERTRQLAPDLLDPKAPFFGGTALPGGYPGLAMAGSRLSNREPVE